jgi:hypothetical protein
VGKKWGWEMTAAKSGFVLSVLFVFLILASGCSTTKGIVNGVQQDTKDTWQAMKKADKWMQKNLW